MLHLSSDPIAKLVAESEQRVRDARHKPPTTKKNEPDDSRIPVQQPDQFDLREQGELVGLGNDATFGEMIGTIDTWEAQRPRAFSPDNEWKNVFLSALQTLLRETMYAKEPKQRQDHLDRVYQWYQDKMLHFDTSENAAASDMAAGHTIKAWGGQWPQPRSSADVDGTNADGSPIGAVYEGAKPPSASAWTSDIGTVDAVLEDPRAVVRASEAQTAVVRKELPKYTRRDLGSSYKRRLAEHGLLAHSAQPWMRPGADVHRLTGAAVDLYGDPDDWQQQDGTQKHDFHARYPWSDQSFDNLTAVQQRALLDNDPSGGPSPQAAWGPVSPGKAAIRSAVVSENMRTVEAERAIHMGTAGPGAELQDTNVAVSRARPATAPPKQRDAVAANWRAQNNFTFYTPSDDPKELRMHALYEQKQPKRVERHKREVEMASALSDWSQQRSRVEQEISRRELGVGWTARGWTSAPERRVLDVTAVDDEESEDEEEGLTDIVEDDGDEDFAPGVEGKPKSVKAGSLKTKERPKSRGAVWLSSYNQKSFHRLEYSKPFVPKAKPPSIRPMYVQQQERDITLHPASITPRAPAPPPADRPQRPMSSLPTKARPMSATEYRNQRIALHGKQAACTEELAATIPIPAADPQWTQEQTKFRLDQTMEMQSVREAFARTGSRMPMATIERALTLPRDRTFEECMSAMQTRTYMLRKDPNGAKKKKKKKGKGKKKKKK